MRRFKKAFFSFLKRGGGNNDCTRNINLENGGMPSKLERTEKVGIRLKSTNGDHDHGCSFLQREGLFHKNKILSAVKGGDEA